MTLLALDLDGVFADHSVGAWHALRAAGLSPAFSAYDEPRYWDLAEAFGLWDKRRDVEVALRAAHADEWFWRKLPLHRDVTPQVLDSLEWLAFRHQLVFVTSRPKGAYEVTQEWIRVKLFGGDTRGWTVLCTPTNKKMQALEALDADAMVEDNVDNAARCSQVCGTWLVRRAYNAYTSKDFAPQVTRAASTLEVLREWETLFGQGDAQ